MTQVVFLFRIWSTSTCICARCARADCRGIAEALRQRRQRRQRGRGCGGENELERRKPEGYTIDYIYISIDISTVCNIGIELTRMRDGEGGRGGLSEGSGAIKTKRARAAIFTTESRCLR